ncbi:hypothetical protein COB55_05765 [Candidatus Wolfebacteria bacterium]|nr:MAG: hypothetical protein COB55_05765 [Candidatus Wolfebacteria bacterium]
MKKRSKLRRKRSIEKLARSKVEMSIGFDGMRPTATVGGVTIHSPFCGYDGDGKPIYRAITRRETLKRERSAIRLMFECRDEIIAHLNEEPQRC